MEVQTISLISRVNLSQLRLTQKFLASYSEETSCGPWTIQKLLGLTWILKTQK